MQDIGSCLVAMTMLEKLPVTSHILAKNADILVTIKKVSMYSVCRLLFGWQLGVVVASLFASTKLLYVETG